MWQYIQRTGQLLEDGSERACGYSGKGACQNQPAFDHKHNAGPIPAGLYTINAPRDSVEHGPYCLPLQPHRENRMYGRGGFLIHGDSIAHPGTASEGCIILGRPIRQAIWESGDHDLQVLPDRKESSI